MEKFAKMIEKLCEASRRDYANPYDLKWPETLDRDQWFFAPELLSIHGTDVYEKLSEIDKKRLSFYEAVNFFSLNIHGEKPLTEGLARRLYSKRNISLSSYLHHFLDEENKHMIYFAGFCFRYASKIYPDKKMSIPQEYAPGEEDFLFFAKVLIFEEIVDIFNIRMARDERLVPIAREINRLHHRDESRHLVFGREIVVNLFNEYKDQWSEETLQKIRVYLAQYLLATWKEYFNPEVYKDSNISDPYALTDRVFDSSACRTRRTDISENCIRFLLKNGILEKEPSL